MKIEEYGTYLTIRGVRYNTVASALAYLNNFNKQYFKNFSEFDERVLYKKCLVSKHGKVLLSSLILSHNNSVYIKIRPNYIDVTKEIVNSNKYFTIDDLRSYLRSFESVEFPKHAGSLSKSDLAQRGWFVLRDK